MNLDTLLAWLTSTELAKFIQLSAWAFPAIESVHVIAIAIVVGTIAIVDLRLVGIASKHRAVTEMLKDTLKWVWGAYAVALASGSLMFISAADNYAHNFPFQAKMVLMLCAGINMLVFEFAVVRDVAHWDLKVPPPFAARVCGVLSLAFWIAIVTFGRWIGFTKMGGPF